ncbi:MAG: ATP synthase F1 subunit delta [Planctomycetota bacterium]
MAGHSDALSLVYARSLLELAQQAGGEEKILEVNDELETIVELGREDASFREFLGSPIINTTERGEALRKIFNDRITDLTLRFLMVLNQKERLGHLEGVARSYDQLVQEKFGKIEVDVFTPSPMAPDQRTALGDRIRTALGKEPVVHSYTDPSMLGGIKLRIGDQLIDGSVSSRLRRMRQDLLQQGSSSIRERVTRFLEEE